MNPFLWILEIVWGFLTPPLPYFHIPKKKLQTYSDGVIFFLSNFVILYPRHKFAENFSSLLVLIKKFFLLQSSLHWKQPAWGDFSQQLKTFSAPTNFPYFPKYLKKSVWVCHINFDKCLFEKLKVKCPDPVNIFIPVSL